MGNLQSLFSPAGPAQSGGVPETPAAPSPAGHASEGVQARRPTQAAPDAGLPRRRDSIAPTAAAIEAARPALPKAVLAGQPNEVLALIATHLNGDDIARLRATNSGLAQGLREPHKTALLNEAALNVSELSGLEAFIGKPGDAGAELRVRSLPKFFQAEPLEAVGHRLCALNDAEVEQALAAFRATVEALGSRYRTPALNELYAAASKPADQFYLHQMSKLREAVRAGEPVAAAMKKYGAPEHLTGLMERFAVLGPGREAVLRGEGVLAVVRRLGIHRHDSQLELERIAIEQAGAGKAVQEGMPAATALAVYGIATEAGRAELRRYVPGGSDT
jgi:hypothetical protein